MTFFDWFMAILGIINLAALIFWAVCKLNPACRRNEKVNDMYKFIVGYDADDIYEIE